MECTLFGNYVDKLNAIFATGENQHVLMNIQDCKVKVF